MLLEHRLMQRAPAHATNTPVQAIADLHCAVLSVTAITLYCNQKLFNSKNKSAIYHRTTGAVMTNAHVS